ncbi:flagellar M-ring protein FliF, partial [Escherichia coli]|nr:flagellar M-ring protein FliF [Escherichia coli]
VAVLIDGQRAIDDTGTETWQPIPQPELDALEALVASAVGFDAARGDVITLRSMPFEPIAQPGIAAEPGLLADLDLMTLAQVGVLAATALILGLFVLRPILTSRASDQLAALPTPTPALTGEIDDGVLPRGAVNTLPSTEIDDSPAALSVPSDPVERLRQMIEDRREETLQ